MRRLIIASVIGAALALAAPASSPAAVVDCDHSAGPLITITSARNMTCAAAARDQRRRNNPTSRRFRTPGGFVCTQKTGVDVAGTWRCVRGSKAYRFAFVD